MGRTGADANSACCEENCLGRGRGRPAPQAGTQRAFAQKNFAFFLGWKAVWGRGLALSPGGTQGPTTGERRAPGPGTRASVSPARGPPSAAPSDSAGRAGRQGARARGGRPEVGARGPKIPRAARPREAEAWAGGGRREAGRPR